MLPNTPRPSFFPQQLAVVPSTLQEEQRYWSLHPDLVLSPESAHEMVRSYELMEEFLRSDVPQRVGLSTRLGRLESMRGHGIRVAVFSLFINQELQRIGSEVVADTRILAMAALFHDIGKLNPKIHNVIMSSERIAKTDTKAWDTIRLHPKVGSGAIQDMLEIDSDERERVAEAVHNHHERADGTGYYNTHPSETSIEAKIITVADTMDVMMGKRPYKRKSMPPQSIEQVIEELDRCSGHQFDPTIAGATKSLRPPQGEFISYTF
jgi:HD-GYP domain-containing protein (c-di-GMP phosphodiesterase class II)